MASVRVQVRFSLATSTEDANVAVNTFHFFNIAEAYESHRDRAFAEVANFYTATRGGMTNTLGQQLSPCIARAVEMRAYNLEDPPQREPTFDGFTLPAADSPTTVMPYEVAVVLSLRGNPPASPRRRGRLYIGPLADGWMATGDSDNPPFIDVTDPASNGRNLALAAEALASTETNLGWSIRSQASGLFVLITNGYVDSLPDTQRRRGNTDPVLPRYEWSI